MSIMRAVVLICAFIAGLLAPGVGLATTIDDYRSGCVDSLSTNNTTGTVTMFVVPAGMRFVLTDVEFSERTPIGSQYRIALTLKTGSTIRWRRTVIHNTVWVSDPATSWTTGIVFGEGEAVQMEVNAGNGGAIAYGLCWSGYVLPSATSGVVPGGRTGDLQLGLFPNPSEGLSQIRFHLDRREQVLLAVFDVQGKRVRRLYSGPMDAGEHVVSWNGRDDAGRSVPTGTYFAQLGIGSQRRVEKVSRIR